MPDPLAFQDLATIEWHDRSVVCRLHRPALVLSTSRSHGGVREDVTAAINHQICVPGQCATDRVPESELDATIGTLAERLGCEPSRAVTMLTAAAMEHAGWAERAFNDVHVLSLVTAGVAENAARAGDPAAYYETADGWRCDGDDQPAGTINVLLLIDHPMTPGALVKAGIMLTEAKAATLQALAVRSFYGPAIATGTGTDQYVVACPQEGPFALREAQAHTKLGRMIATATDEALRDALERQNRLSARSQASVRRLLARFGAEVEPGDRDTDPGAVAAAASLAAILDHLRWGVLDSRCRPAIVADHAAHLAAAIAGNRRAGARAEQAVRDRLARCANVSDGELVALAVAAGVRGP